MVLPLHVFEPRYRALVSEILDGDRTFGVVMIERGMETGGEDQRSDFGTTTRVIEAQEFTDGRWALVTVGVERFRVDRWLPDDPYPVAEIEPWPDESEPVDNDRFDRVVSKFTRCQALASEAGFDVGSGPEQLVDPGLASMQMAALLPVSAYDKQRLLAAPGPDSRIGLLESTIDETIELIELRLAGDSAEPPGGRSRWE